MKTTIAKVRRMRGMITPIVTTKLTLDEAVWGDGVVAAVNRPVVRSRGYYRSDSTFQCNMNIQYVQPYEYL